jgi:hypothetical protein
MLTTIASLAKAAILIGSTQKKRALAKNCCTLHRDEKTTGLRRRQQQQQDLSLSRILCGLQLLNVFHLQM